MNTSNYDRGLWLACHLLRSNQANELSQIIIHRLKILDIPGTIIRTTTMQTLNIYEHGPPSSALAAAMTLMVVAVDAVAAADELLNDVRIPVGIVTRRNGALVRF